MILRKSNKCKEHKLVPLGRGELFFCSLCMKEFEPKIKKKRKRKKKLKGWEKIR